MYMHILQFGDVLRAEMQTEYILRELRRMEWTFKSKMKSDFV